MVSGTRLMDGRQFVDCFAACIFNDATYDMCKRQAYPPGNGCVKLHTYLQCILAAWAETQGERKTWRKGTLEAADGIEHIVSICKGILRMLSHVPGEFASIPDDLEAALPIAMLQTTGRKKVDSESHLGTLNDAGAMMQNHMVKQEAWRIALSVSIVCLCLWHTSTPRIRRLAPWYSTVGVCVLSRTAL